MCTYLISIVKTNHFQSVHLDYYKPDLLHWNCDIFIGCYGGG